MKEKRDEDLRNAIARARDWWLASDEGIRCSEGTASGQYLRNRLTCAFIAGYNRANAAKGRLQEPIE